MRKYKLDKKNKDKITDLVRVFKANYRNGKHDQNLMMLRRFVRKTNNPLQLYHAQRRIALTYEVQGQHFAAKQILERADVWAKGVLCPKDRLTGIMGYQDLHCSDAYRLSGGQGVWLRKTRNLIRACLNDGISPAALSTAYHSLAFTLLHLRRFKDAVQIVDEALRECSARNLYYPVERLGLLLGVKLTAVSHMRKSITSIQPILDEAFQLLARLRQQSTSTIKRSIRAGLPRAKVEKLRRSFTRKLFILYHNLAYDLRRAGEPQASLKMVAKALELDPNFGPTNFLASALHLSVLNERDKSLHYLQKAVKDIEWASEGGCTTAQKEFNKWPEFQPVTNDPEFLAVLQSLEARAKPAGSISRTWRATLS